MKRKLLSLLLAVSVIGMCLSGCGTKKEESVEVNPVIEETEETEDIEETLAVDETNDIEANAEENTEVEKVNDEATESEDLEEEIVIDEKILEEPVPKTLDETVELMRSLPNGQLLSDFMFKVMNELDQVEFSDIEWTNALGEYITELETTNPTLLEEFYNAEVK